MKLNAKTQIFEMLIPIVVLIIGILILHQTAFDIKLANIFYDSHNQWVYRDNFYLETIFHKGGVKLVVVILAVMIIYLIKSYKLKRNEAVYEFIKYVTLSSVLTILIVAIAKNFSTLSCPWDSVIFGGKSEYLPIWLSFSPDYPRGHCFPAGHSSGGYAFLSMYYGHSFIFRKRRLLFLLPGIVIGGIFGIIQQMRGAHFLSHDLVTIMVSIICAWLTYLILRKYSSAYEK